ncbi:hypothetical protein BY458DRAFT_522612 [Sporodiniella umbellata]|nr:hypothetical protein BY458DRAFT_522612 [Sporodiniella umbellata]
MYNYKKKLSATTDFTATIFIDNIPQLVQFLNLIYLPDDPNNTIAYERQLLSMKDILSKVWECSDLFDDTSSSSFNKWCNDKKLGLLNSEVKRRKNSLSKRISLRCLYVLKEEFIDDTIDKIVNYLPKYQHNIETLKKEGYLIIGYARKSKQNIDLHVRVRLLQLMVDRLQERSLVDKIFVSVNSSSSDPLIERDSKPNDIIEKLKYVDGDIQELLKFVVVNPKICLVTLDSAGLTTNSNDLKGFIKNNTSIKKIIIDNLPHTNTINIIERDEILANHEKLKMFNGRSKLYQRSK